MRCGGLRRHVHRVRALRANPRARCDGDIALLTAESHPDSADREAVLAIEGDVHAGRSRRVYAGRSAGAIPCGRAAAVRRPAAIRGIAAATNSAAVRAATVRIGDVRTTATRADARVDDVVRTAATTTNTISDGATANSAVRDVTTATGRDASAASRSEATADSGAAKATSTACVRGAGKKTYSRTKAGLRASRPQSQPRTAATPSRRTRHECAAAR